MTATMTIMEQLKTGTAELHKQAEGAALERALVQGKITTDGFKAYLGQRLPIHEALEAELTKLLAARPEFGSIVEPAVHFQSPRIKEDLAFFGAADTEPLPSTQKAVDAIHAAAAANPVGVLGYCYVAEGSNNGARYIAKAVRGGLRLEGANGTRFLDPYGDEQPLRWRAFIQAMNATEFTETEREAIIAGGLAMFQAIIEVDKEIGAKLALA